MSNSPTIPLAASIETKFDGVQEAFASVSRVPRYVWHFVGVVWRLRFAERVVLASIRRINQRYASKNLEMAEWEKFLPGEDFEAEIDPQMTLRDLLEQGKVEALANRAAFQAMLQDVSQFPKLKVIADEYRQTVRLLAEAFDTMNALQWQIAEHDANFSVRRPGFVASSAQETSDILDRIAAGE